MISHDGCLVCAFDLTVLSADNTRSPCPFLYFMSFTKSINHVFDRGDPGPSQNKLAREEYEHVHTTVWLEDFDQGFFDGSLGSDRMDLYNPVVSLHYQSRGGSPSEDLKVRFCVPWAFRFKKHIGGLSGNRRCPLDA